MLLDKEIQADVIEELQIDPTVDATQIGVAVKDGVVTFTGYVPTYGQQWAAVKAAKRVYGVKGIADDLQVHLPSSAQRTDTEVAQAALTALKWNTSVPDDVLKVTVENGWVTLEGSVDWQYQKDAAEFAVRYLTGVKGVINDIAITPKIKPKEVQEKIQSAFERSADLDARRIGVKTNEGKVTLHGNVRSWTEHDEAQRAAWSVPGVREVENDLVVTP